MTNGIAKELIEYLGLVPLPIEGGYYKVTYRSDDLLPKEKLPERYESERAMSNAIYYLLEPDTFSAFHMLESDEIWHFYTGDSVELSLIHPNGQSEAVVLGSDVLAGENPQFLVRRGTWQGAKLVDGGNYALLGTTIAPGYEDADFEIGVRTALLEAFPSHEALIRSLTNE